MREKIAQFNFLDLLKFKIQQYKLLCKFGLSSFVVFSSVIGFIFGSMTTFIVWPKLLWFTLGGTLVTFASNAINEFIEKDSDKLMDRTKNRPLPTRSLSQFEVILFIGIAAVSGVLIITLAVNPIAGVLSALSLFIYGFIYTPMKKVNSLAVMVGAIPGALPPLLGYVAASNSLDQTAIWLFLVQFFWQFPHFWSIAWLSYEDYKKADIMLLPSSGGKNKQSTFVIFIYSFALIPLSLFPLINTHVLSFGTWIHLLSSIGITYLAFLLYRSNTDKNARKLMFGSFAYLLIFLISIFF